MIGVITGSGFYELGSGRKETVETGFGNVFVDILEIDGQEVAHIPRHGSKHEKLPNMINHKANIAALHKLGCKLIVSTSVCGLTNPKLELGKLLLFSDLFFPENRLPSGELCTFFMEPGDIRRGHYITSSHFNSQILKQLESKESYSNLTYGHVNGPRFNSKSEIAFLKQHTDAISQTSGPEAILSGELEIPYILLGFGIDYANGIMKEPTPIETLNKNLELSKDVFKKTISKILKMKVPKFEGFVYRFE